MKKLLTLLALTALFGLFSCQKENGEPNGGELLVTINTDLSAQLLVRGAGDGKADEINRYTLLVYTDGSTTPYEKKVNTKTEGGSFTLSLVRGGDYTFAIWADCGTGPYTIGDDGAVSFDADNFKVNDESFDAFFGTFSITNIQSSVGKSITLERPFGQLNIRTEDYQASIDKGFTPNEIEVSLSDVYTEFNILTGEVSGQKDVKYSAAVNRELLSFSYLFAPDDDNYSINVAANISFAENSGQCIINVPEVPVKRNYQTTIEGNILTRSSGLTISIDPEFNGNNLIGIPVRIVGVNKSFSTINGALDYLKINPTAGTRIIALDGTYNEDVTLPSGITLQGVGTSTVLTGYLTLNAGSAVKNFKHIWAAPATPSTAVYIKGSNVTMENIELEGISKKADGTSAEAIVTETGATGLTVKNCKFTGYWKGIYLNNCVNLSVTGSEFTNMNPFSTDEYDGSMTITGNTFRRSALAGDSQQPHLIVTNTDASSLDSSTWSDGLKAVVNQIINDNTWSGSKRIRVQCTSGTTFDARVTAAIQ